MLSEQHVVKCLTNWTLLMSAKDELANQMNEWGKQLDIIDERQGRIGKSNE